MPRGGPDGGDGGRGGDVVLRADPALATLLDYRYKRSHAAQKGQPGGTNQCTGRDGETLVLRVPVGTQVYDEGTGELVADLSEAGAEVVVCRGGRGGRGNEHFATASRRTPDFAQPGEEGEERDLRLELKLIADVGLVGFPNAGKSTFVSRVSRARPKVADYPFTTLRPHLGVVRVDDERSYVVADLPGLIEGAAEGAGLGHQFLRHIERTSLFLFLITQDATPGRDPVGDFRTLRMELGAYDPTLLLRPFLVVITQLDRTEVREQLEAVRGALRDEAGEVLAISAVTGEGLPELMTAVARRLLEAGRWGAA